MKIIKITKQSINEAVDILKNGGTVVYPTETAYALGADATNARAMAKIFKIKNRPAKKDLPMICATKKMASDFFKFGKIELKLAKKYWPGPLSIILELRITNYELRNKKREIPVRISSNKIARDLARKLGRPIIATSANISGAGAIYDSKEVIAEFTGKKYQPDLVLDGGKLPRRLPSTIIKIENNKIIVVRKGEIKIQWLNC